MHTVTYRSSGYSMMTLTYTRLEPTHLLRRMFPSPEKVPCASFLSIFLTQRQSLLWIILSQIVLFVLVLHVNDIPQKPLENFIVYTCTIIYLTSPLDRHFGHFQFLLLKQCYRASLISSVVKYSPANARNTGLGSSSGTIPHAAE